MYLQCSLKRDTVIIINKTTFTILWCCGPVVCVRKSVCGENCFIGLQLFVTLPSPCENQWNDGYVSLLLSKSSGVESSGKTYPPSHLHTHTCTHKHTHTHWTSPSWLLFDLSGTNSWCHSGNPAGGEKIVTSQGVRRWCNLCRCLKILKEPEMRERTLLIYGDHYCYTSTLQKQKARREAFNWALWSTSELECGSSLLVMTVFLNSMKGTSIQMDLRMVMVSSPWHNSCCEEEFWSSV